MAMLLQNLVPSAACVAYGADSVPVEEDLDFSVDLLRFLMLLFGCFSASDLAGLLALFSWRAAAVDPLPALARLPAALGDVAAALVVELRFERVLRTVFGEFGAAFPSKADVPDSLPEGSKVSERACFTDGDAVISKLAAERSGCSSRPVGRGAASADFVGTRSEACCCASWCSEGCCVIDFADDPGASDGSSAQAGDVTLASVRCTSPAPFLRKGKSSDSILFRVEASVHVGPPRAATASGDFSCLSASVAAADSRGASTTRVCGGVSCSTCDGERKRSACLASGIACFGAVPVVCRPPAV